MDELRDCPFCGALPIKDKFGYIQCNQDLCTIFGVPFTGPAWDHRPMESAITSEKDYWKSRAVDITPAQLAALREEAHHYAQAAFEYKEKLAEVEKERDAANAHTNALEGSLAAALDDLILSDARAEALREALEALVMAKGEKDAYGKTAVYACLREIAWDKARSSLSSHPAPAVDIRRQHGILADRCAYLEQWIIDRFTFVDTANEIEGRMFDHLDCPHCGGSGHIDDVQAPAVSERERGLVKALKFYASPDSWKYSTFLAGYDRITESPATNDMGDKARNALSAVGVGSGGKE